MFPEILFGHLIGDYLLQNDWLATNKGKYDRLGWITCIIHCLLYTLAVCVTTWTFSLSWILLVFFSHFLIDKFGVVEKYSKLIKGRSVGDYLTDKNNKEHSPMSSIDAGFTAFVYVVRDNTIHLLLMYYGWILLIL